MLHSNLVIRDAVLQDVEVILELIHLKAEFDGCPDTVFTTIDRLKEDLFGKKPLTSVLLAEVDQEPIGFATYHRIYSTFLAKPGLWLDDLYIKTEFRNQGIGRELMSRLCEIAQASGCGKIDWTVAVNNSSAIHFYQKMGATILQSTRLCRLDQAAIAQNTLQLQR